VWPRAPRRCATSPITRATRESIARESLDIYAPLANRLGIWQLKWELEDLSFRFLEPDTYKRIARMLDERRVEREQFIVDAVAPKSEVAAIGVKADVYGRPKHIYSIYNKMRAKRLISRRSSTCVRCACWSMR
jgi:GTP pyrophosphokinase